MIHNGDCLDILPQLDSESVDLLVTDPPYGISFMGKEWDKALPDIRVWAECLRVLKTGAFAFVMSIPRQDCLARMIINLQDAGFEVGFTPIYWAYASGFPKAQNIGKAVDKRLGAEREVVGEHIAPDGKPYSKRQPHQWTPQFSDNAVKDAPPPMITAPSTPQAKALDGSYGGFQPKPAVEVIIVAMKPLSEKTFVDQALKNRKGITWLDSCRVPHDGEKLGGGSQTRDTMIGKEGWDRPWRHDKEAVEAKCRRVNESVEKGERSGRFPANLLVSDDVLNTGEIIKGGKPCNQNRQGLSTNKVYGVYNKDITIHEAPTDSGSFSRYFDLDAWAKTFPFLIVPKASKGEKNKGLGIAVPRAQYGSTPRKNGTENKSPNNHPTVKPLKLMSYLITLGSREGDTVLDPYIGSGTTALACQLLSRECIGIEIEEKYCEIANNRCSQGVLVW